MSDFWRFRVVQCKGRKAVVRATAVSSDCGERFPHTIDWLVRSLYCAGGQVESTMDRLVDALEREAGVEGELGFDLSEPNDRRAAGIVAEMSVELVDDPDDPDAANGPQADYAVTFKGPTLAKALATLEGTWGSPCFDLVSASFRLRKEARWLVVHWEEGRYDDVTGDAAKAWQDASPDALTLAKEGDHAAAVARVARAVRSGYELVFCNHAGDSARLPIVRRARKAKKKPAKAAAPKTLVAAAAPLEPRARPCWVPVGELTRLTRPQLEGLAALAGTTVDDVAHPKDMLVLGALPAAEEARLLSTARPSFTEAHLQARHLLGASLEERCATIATLAAERVVDEDGAEFFPWAAIGALVEGAPAHDLDALFPHVEAALSSWPDDARSAPEGWLAARDRRLELARSLSLSNERPHAVAALPSFPVPACRHVELRLDEKATLDALKALAGRPIRSLYVSAKGAPEAIVSALPAELRSLDVSFSGGGAPLAKAIAGSPLASTLERLDLGWNDLRPAGVRALAAVAWPRLTRLSLRDNRIDDDALCALLPRLENLESLSLVNNALTHVSAEALASPRLQTLDLGGNALGDAGLEVLARSTSLSSLRALRLMKCGVRELSSLVGSPFARSLQTLDLRGNEVTHALSGLLSAPSLAGLDALFLGDVDGGLTALREVGKAAVVRPRMLSIDGGGSPKRADWKSAEALSRVEWLKLGGDLSQETLVALFSQAPLAALRVLEVKGIGDALKALTQARWAAGLRRLRLFGLSRGHGALLASAPFAANLTELYAFGLDVEERARVRAVYGARVFV